MRLLLKPVCCALTLVLGLGLGGCLPASRTRLDEEKEPHFLAGKSRLNALDYQGALECFEKALESNPRSGLAHFEAGLLYENHKLDHAAAIYHYQRFLELRTNSGYADVVRQHILACKQELAKTVLLGPVTQSLQREFEQLTERNKRLQDELDRWRAYATRLAASNAATATASPAVAPSAPAVPSAGANAVNSSATTSGPSNEPRPKTAASARTHTVRSGETPVAIAHKYGVRLEALMAANPSLDARRLKIGQTLKLP